MLDCVRVEYCGQSANLILQKLDKLGRNTKWKLMAHTYGQHYHIFMVLYLVVHMSELQKQNPTDILPFSHYLLETWKQL